ncbi:MAG: hypothetical protein A2046_12115 [Bacteroidetes bacterium GWA2_30_7]|nr:MAG: hypothetical protein A2046_12115 [Bacteroidetes bacterium GWA2_30_7]
MKQFNNSAILIIDHIHNDLITKLQELGFLVDYKPVIKKTEIEEIISNYNGIILRSKIRIDNILIDKASKLEFIGRAGSGLENIDTVYAEKKGITCFNSPEGNRDSVGEHTLGLLLNLLNKISKAGNEIKKGIWNRNDNWGIELKGKTVGIIGYGNMGGSFAKKLSGFEVNVIAYDKFKKDFSDSFVQEVDLETIFNRADILSLHIPLTNETQYLISSEFLNRFKKNIFLLNTSRGQIVNTKELVDCINSGKVLGAGLDVIEYENHNFENLGCKNLSEDFDYLLNSDKVIITPHVAGWSNESFYKVSMVLAEKILKFYQLD